MDKQNSIEAITWLTSNKNANALAGNRFNNTKTAINFIEQLYQLGATNVVIDDIYDEDWRIQKEGGPYADSLFVDLPTDTQKRIKLFEIFNQESEHEGFDKHIDEGQDSVMLWWD